MVTFFTVYFYHAYESIVLTIFFCNNISTWYQNQISEISITNFEKNVNCQLKKSTIFRLSRRQLNSTKLIETHSTKGSFCWGGNTKDFSNTIVLQKSTFSNSQDFKIYSLINSYTEINYH
ncbi:hypothetical protein BLOT_004594 [Blomia tropicalis]|nr:hypothetical protein BLOT_004594 [Blomia tropicalis]